jgi:hypothetical protein
MDKYDFNFKMKNLDETETELLVSKELAQGLAMDTNSKNPLKSFLWAQSLFKDGIVEVDLADKPLFEEIIKNLKFVPLLKAQILLVKPINKEVKDGSSTN